MKTARVIPRAEINPALFEERPSACTPVQEEKKQSTQSNAIVAEQKRGDIEKINLRLQKFHDSFLDGVNERDDIPPGKPGW